MKNINRLSCYSSKWIIFTYKYLHLSVYNKISRQLNYKYMKLYNRIMLGEGGSCMRVDMGYAVFEAEQIPALGFEGEVVGESIFFCDNFYNATCVSMGNPNCVIMLERVDREKALHLGPYVENAKYFPNRINMQLCQIVDEKNIQVEIYERGAGYTFASGTGACAAAAASHRLGLVEDAVTVHMHGGDLFIEFEKDGRIFMTGPVVYIGKITVAEQFFA